MEKICEGRVAVVTGGGRGLGRSHALELARHGARVVVNDLGGGPDGTGSDPAVAEAVAEEIRAAGGEAVASGHDVADSDGAREVVRLAIDTFGGLDVLVNNAGILRDRTLAGMSDEDWDSVVRVHLRGTFAPSRAAAAYWRDRAKSTGAGVDGRIICTTSPVGLYGNFGQTNYIAAKGGIASFTLGAAQELARYGVTVNTIAPTAATRLVLALMTDEPPAEFVAKFDPGFVSPVVVWLASPQSAAVTGRIFDVRGNRVALVESWRIGAEILRDEPWDPAALGEVVSDLVAKAAPTPDISGYVQPQEG
ncbi:SDR family NAD(P)-dependent oxidoreductase [Trujillonella endophytica]|uniref:NAD(P)-dependent dehydrogenase, short-chain alcohol dehydrogenase family n=1 Tax=Trujillonella endophytica TaxID=673521 RepID=A0A1H8WHP5_9ACTN|nr:SDR family NAD(P)-dependent oxidoreductase [Trujillella endophytica]SEP27185.1 NAD(P)-dependent dehydrogenase, short-chain alcohol dehydrogenase family [Trujillella endophytica]